MNRRTMKSLLSAMLLLFCLLFFPQTSNAQPRKRLEIEQVQVGFGSLKAVAEFKSGFWTPVYIYVKGGPEGTPGPGIITVESTDSDEVRGRYRAAVPQLNPEEIFMVQTYTRPGRTEVGVTVEINNRIVASQQEDFHSMDLGQMLFLTVGSRIPSLRPALNPKSPNQQEEDENFYDRQGRCRVTGLDDIRMLPKVWFAYEPVDLLILTTGNRDGFAIPFLNEREGRKEALAEWVRRGGKLVVSVGKNQDVLRDREFEVITSLLPVNVTGTAQVPHLRSVEQYARVGADIKFQVPRAGTFEIAKLEPKQGRSVDRLLDWDREKKEAPLIVRGSYGLGSVTVVAFDLDQPPFKGWKGQKGFLTRLVTDTTAAFSDPEADPKQPNYRGMPQQVTDVGGQLETALEEFEEIPVISFGWVALFILIYILVVGPLDYFFLKKVVKRLELTWITFPTVVIAISVAAYFTAYWLKGNDQKINKVDLVDIDLHTQQIYGNSWFTIFSPRIQHYTVGLEPVETDWAPAPPAGKPRWPVLVSWMGRQETGWGGSNRGQSQGLFRRAYDYADNAAGMSGVPIQVWSTKSFATSWQASFDSAKPLFSADLKLTPAGQYTGTITSRLPVPLEEAHLYYDKNWYPLGKDKPLVPNLPFRVDGIFREGVDMSIWKQTSSQVVTSGKTRVGSAGGYLKQLMFFEKQNGLHNYSLYELNQTWRLPHKDEVFVVGRIPRKEGPAEDITIDPSSPSRIWLGALPATGGPRPIMNGTLAQETYVRVLIPVKAPK